MLGGNFVNIENFLLKLFNKRTREAIVDDDDDEEANRRLFHIRLK